MFRAHRVWCLWIPWNIASTMTEHLMNSTNCRGMNIFTIFVVGLFLLLIMMFCWVHFDIYHSFFWAEVLQFELFLFLQFVVDIFIYISNILSLSSFIPYNPYSLPRMPTSMWVLPHMPVISLPPPHIRFHAILPAASRGQWISLGCDVTENC